MFHMSRGRMLVRMHDGERGEDEWRPEWRTSDVKGEAAAEWCTEWMTRRREWWLECRMCAQCTFECPTECYPFMCGLECTTACRTGLSVELEWRPECRPKSANFVLMHSCVLFWRENKRRTTYGMPYISGASTFQPLLEHIRGVKSLLHGIKISWWHGGCSKVNLI